ncbi:hypothetical protein [Nostoc sp. 2RC]|nr:hypothetical protein [Nostoc sp. 2RC]
MKFEKQEKLRAIAPPQNPIPPPQTQMPSHLHKSKTRSLTPHY